MFPAPFLKTVPRRTPPPHIYLRIFALCLAASAALFAGCKNDASSGVSEYYADVTYADFEGKWSFTYDSDSSTDSYIIANDTMIYDDSGDYEGYDPDFSAKIIHCYRFVVFNTKSDINDTSGVFIIKFTSPSGNKDKFGAVYYQNKAAASVKMATAYNADSTQPLYDTEKEAVSAFVSISAANNYVSMWGGPYKRNTK